MQERGHKRLLGNKKTALLAQSGKNKKFFKEYILCLQYITL